MSSGDEHAWAASLNRMITMSGFLCDAALPHWLVWVVDQEDTWPSHLRHTFRSLNIKVFQLLKRVVDCDDGRRVAICVCLLAQARYTVSTHPHARSLHTGTYCSSRSARIIGDVFVMHNGVTWFSASVSNVVQTSSADRSSGGTSEALVDARQSSSLRTFSKPQSVRTEVLVEQRINNLDAWTRQSSVGSSEYSTRVPETRCFTILGHGAPIKWS